MNVFFFRFYSTIRDLSRSDKSRLFIQGSLAFLLMVLIFPILSVLELIAPRNRSFVERNFIPQFLSLLAFRPRPFDIFTSFEDTATVLRVRQAESSPRLATTTSWQSPKSLPKPGKISTHTLYTYII